MTRSLVIILTLGSGLAGILLAMKDGGVNLANVLLVLTGLCLAHATNNLVNDWTDYRLNVDQQNPFRAQYGTHVLIDGLITEGTFLLVTAFTAAGALACGFMLYFRLGESVVYLMTAGAFFVLFYTWPIKHYAMGELSVLLVWGPLITAGSYFVLAGELTSLVLLTSLIVGMGPTLLIFGKHMDKAESDAALGVMTLPAYLGPSTSRQICRLILVVHWLLIGFVLLQHGAWYLAAVGIAAPAAFRFFRQLGNDRPLQSPGDYPEGIWPLWFSAGAFQYTRLISIGLLTGLLLNLFN